VNRQAGVKIVECRPWQRWG